ncbi:spermidine/putrescine transport system substrate-binding protein [Caminicella sporogenes DSM 14501]|uniref:Spermidine/putrescine transport system substrate-binding protein n=1 Tax=Caminicella sporogenes DSM 14501 TaxID=1121266 RepID=A0A1M6S3D8_9FIRM|nr:ABC transporter substrate-binding protein [Caminicella sporogenes]RKD27183.1 spermidine/putrescine ABC transporter substrate-binding protein [Caminicella sporogenes]WIF95516.1 ABC transporter substrate-binding protein [Caminicella sporogenes]SHK39253.1 spermidine/putrescine transport system substrate-binding protein [Caminicella sporogenes DSM 14501]
MRGIMRKVFAISMIVLILASITGCQKENKVTLNVYNWGDYIDESVIKEFEKKYGIKVNYEMFDTNEAMYAKIKSGGVNYDVAFPSDYMISKMIKEDMLYKIDFNNIPNYKYIDERFKNLEYDPNSEYSVPYMWGTVGILYNKKMVKDKVDSWNILWDEKYKKQIIMQDSQRETIGVALQKLGYSVNTKNIKELEEAKRELIKQKPLVLAYVVDEVKDKMVSGEAALAVVWAGDAVAMKEENPDLEFVVPKEGSNFFVDAMVIPKTSKHKKEAEMFINFMCEPEIAFKNTDYIKYSTPHTEARKMLDPKVANDPVAYPSDEVLKRCEVYKDLSDIAKEYDRIWTEIKAAK